MKVSRLITPLTCLAVALALTVIVFGAYVRLSDAGLGCPDWPGCYGQLVVPDTGHAQAAEQFGRPVEVGKAWKEMVHRYLASTLGLLIVILACLTWLERRNVPTPSHATRVPYLLVPLVMFQGALGMWTVTLLLKPVVVSSHLLGGMAVLALLWWTALRRLESSTPARETANAPSRLLLAAALLMVVIQIVLGGWTSANYAALACTDFPTCQSGWWPTMDFREAFILWRGLGINYEYGVLDGPARTAIHFTHRLGALATTVLVVAAAISAMRCHMPAFRRTGVIVLAMLALQVTLGISNVRLGLPLKVAVAHNGVAALLLLALVTLNFLRVRRVRS